MFKYLILLLFSFQITTAQTVLGHWKTVDENGVAKSVVKVYKTDNNKIEGKIVRILKDSERDRRCVKCEGSMKNEPIEGLVIMRGLEPEGDEYENGKITDPEKGRTYSCKIWIDEDNKDVLNVRGYWSFFYKTQHWERVEEGEF
jgi:uncharacterized protein (DUF2147 family)